MRLSFRLLSIAIAILWSETAARADLVSPYGGETAPNFAEIEVAADRVRVTLEIDPADYPFFVGPDVGDGRSLADRTGDTLSIAADDVALAPSSRRVELRPRKPRATAAAAVVPRRPRSAEVVFVELEFPFVGHPGTFTFAPPRDDGGMPTVSLGLLVSHMGVPVTDYRYLSGAETLVADWQDPWFSAFANPNLTRHHKSPLMSFLSMEPREVRHEIILRLRDLERWTDLGLGATASFGSAEMAEVTPRAAAFLRARNPVIIDGERVLPADIRIARIAVGAEGLRVLDETETADRATALVGVVLSYPRTSLAREVEMTWELFPEGTEVVPVTLTDPAGGVPAGLRIGDPVVRWTNYLTDWTEPRVRPVRVATAGSVDLPLLAIALGLGAAGAAGVAVRHRGSRRVVLPAAAVALAAAGLAASLTTRIALPGRSAPSAEAARQLMAGMLDDIGTAMLETRPEGFAAALAPFVAPDRAGAVGAELRRGLSVTLPSGAMARTEAIVDLEGSGSSRASAAPAARSWPPGRPP